MGAKRWKTPGAVFAPGARGPIHEDVSAQINLGRDTNGLEIAIDLEELLATRLLVQGNSGSGKSHLLRRILEECAGLVQQVVIDPEGDFASHADAAVEARHLPKQRVKERRLATSHTASDADDGATADA